MLRFHTFVLLAVVGASSGIVAFGSRALAEDFRVDNAVYEGDQKQASTQSTTIFHNGTVYDCLTNPAETIVFDKAGGRFILLNTANQTRAELTTDNVAAFTNRLQVRAAEKSDPVIKFLADPKFQEKFDETTGELTLQSTLVSYRLVLSTNEGEGAANQYREFSDWYAKLNTLLSPSSRPPFGRLAVNAAVANHKAIASQVILSVASSKAGGQPTTIRSTHQVVRPLTQADLDRVAEIHKSLKSFKLVSFDKYRKAS
jgi:hypothetical protein